MKSYLVLIILLIATGASSQLDSSKVKITFQTPNDTPVTISEVTYGGDVKLSGYNSDGAVFQSGKLTIKRFLFNAPSSYLFKKDCVYNLHMNTTTDAGFNFSINTEANDQIWLLTPPGKNFYKSRKNTSIGIAGALLSTVIFGLVAMSNKHEMDIYKMELDYYNQRNQILGGLQQTPPPEKPKITSLNTFYQSLQWVFLPRL